MQRIWNIDGGNHRASFTGKFYRLDGAQTDPHPFHPIRIWLGALGPKMLRLTGRLGNGSTPYYGYAPPDQIPKMQQTINHSLDAAIQRRTKFPGIIICWHCIGKQHEESRSGRKHNKWRIRRAFRWFY